MWGWSWLAQLVLGIAAVSLFGRAQASGRWLPVRVVTVLLAFTPAFAGHAIAAERLVALAVVSDGLHILGAAGWLGTLAVMLIVGISAALATIEDHGALAADLVTSFSPVALACAGLAGVTGLLTAWIHTGQLEDMWATPYGRVLLLKLGILTIVAASGAYNWRRVLPRLGDRVGAARVSKSASVEVLVAVLVLFVTAVLVALPTPLATRGP
jgi:putative copper export protein